jgi:hypothetical protein
MGAAFLARTVRKPRVRTLSCKARNAVRCDCGDCGVRYTLDSAAIPDRARRCSPASCKEHERVTSYFEGSALRGTFGPVREHEGIGSGRRKKRPLQQAEALAAAMRASGLAIAGKPLIDVEPIDIRQTLAVIEGDRTRQAVRYLLRGVFKRHRA